MVSSTPEVVSFLVRGDLPFCMWECEEEGQLSAWIGADFFFCGALVFSEVGNIPRNLSMWKICLRVAFLWPPSELEVNWD